MQKESEFSLATPKCDLNECINKELQSYLKIDAYICMRVSMFA